MPDRPEPPSTRFFNVHLQKTAGTTLRDRFRASLPEAAIYPNGSDGRDWRVSVISLSHLRRQWALRGHEIRLIAGHFPLSTIELLDAEFVTLSVLRPPVERTLSYLRHQKAVGPGDKDRTLEQIYDDPFRYEGLIRNHMVRMFSIGADEMLPGDGVLTPIPDDEEYLDRAKAGVAGLDAFGLQPLFEEFWHDLAARYDLDSTARAVANATEAFEAGPGLVERIAEDNRLDIELYAYAERLYSTRRRNPPGPNVSE